ncbi:MAG: DivIVA domain-containing protein [Acidimicrobiia bacterium]
MDVTPQLLHEIEFREAKRGGYDTRDVDDFLEKLAVGVEQLLAQGRDARLRLEAAESRATEAERRASESGEHDETLKRTLVLAQRTADAAIKEAEEEAARTLGNAQTEADRLLGEAREASARARAEAEAEARQAQEEARAAVLAELRSLETSRDALRADVDALERHLDAQRERIRSATGALQQVLDDPGLLRPQAPPAAAEVAVAEPSPAPAPAEAAGSVVPAVADAPPISLDEPAGEGSWSASDAWDDPVAPPAVDDGPATQAHDVLADDDDDGGDHEHYLAELRRAMAEERPAPTGGEERRPESLFEAAGDRGERSRFGRRR